MSKKRKRISLAVWLALILLTLAGVFLTDSAEQSESIRELMRDAVLHDGNQIDLFGLRVNPGLISAFTVTALLLTGALLIRIFVIPKFKYVPGKLQLLLEQLVGFFDGLGKTNSPHRHGFLNVYLFSAGVYIFFGTLFELFGLQAATTRGTPISLPAPLSDINAAIALGCLSYVVILSGGIAGNGMRGVGKTLKDFSMSFRLFGALLSGLLVTELVYYYSGLSFVLPVVVAVLFTLLHALIQTYVLTMLTSLFYGEVSEVHTPKPGKAKPQTEAQH